MEFTFIMVFNFNQIKVNINFILNFMPVVVCINCLNREFINIKLSFNCKDH